MTSYLFAPSLLFLLVLCALCGAASNDSVKMNVELFKEESIRVLKAKGEGKKSLDIKHAFSSSLVDANGVMIGLAQIIQTDGKRGILTKYIETQGDKWGKKTIKGDGKNWKAQLAWRSNSKKPIVFASVAKNDSVYILSASKVKFAFSSLQKTTNTRRWKIKLSVGTITDGGNAAEKKIKWRTKSLSYRFVRDIQENLHDVSPLDGSAFLTEDGTLVFVLRALSDISNKNVFVIAHSVDPSEDFTFNYVGNTTDCYFSFFPWEKQLIMVPKQCPRNGDGDYKVKVSNDMGKTWEDATGPLAKKLDNLKKGRDSFTTITIEGRRVLLFTTPMPNNNTSLDNVDIGLVIADDNHIQEVGRLFTDVPTIFGGSFLYTNDELFFLDVHDNIYMQAFFRRFKRQLKSIKKLLNTWYPGDKEQVTKLAEPMVNELEFLKEHAEELG